LALELNMSTENPYAPPKMVNEAPMVASVGGALNIAGQGRRFCNLLIDGVVLFIINNGVQVVFGLFYGIMLVGSGRQMNEGDVALINILAFVLSILVDIIFYTICETLLQRTPGKYVTGTMVVNEQGGKPTFPQILGRSAARYIPFEAFSFFGNNGYPIGWHDSLSGTRVIKL
jgi:uncharacterized RDD family membrane protein YckC